MEACENGRPAVAEALVAKCQNLNLTDDNGYSALHLAANEG
jgi:ankyrin repeat protein